jgi:uncharacterized protein YndB with AHSA1/START domain
MRTISDDAIIEDIFIDAPLERVYRALTDSSELVQWWGDPSAYWCTSWTLDLRVGGKWRSEGRNQRGGTFSVEGEFTEIVPPRVLAFTWKPSWVASVTQVRIVLTPQGSGTHLEWTQSGFTGDRKALDDHKGGLPSVVAWLKRYLEARALI